MASWILDVIFHRDSRDEGLAWHGINSFGLLLGLMMQVSVVEFGIARLKMQSIFIFIKNGQTSVQLQTQRGPPRRDALLIRQSQH